MAENLYVNKVVYGGNTLIDLTGDDVAAGDVLSGKLFHLPSGAQGTGSCTYDADTSDATATAAEILLSKTAYKNGAKLTGTMPNNGAVSGTITTVAGEYTVPQGYHDGSGKVSIDATEQAKCIPGVIKAGVELLGVTGTYSGESVTATAVNITPSTSAQTIMPPSGFDYISQANVAAIQYTETDNAAGGKTVSIAA